MVKRALVTRSSFSLTILFLIIEFFDELHYGIESAALPGIRDNLLISYAQIGVLLGLPKVISTIIEPVIMLLGDTRLRKPLIVSGGLVIAAASFMIAGAQSFWVLLLAFILFFPASGAFVTLSQATLMDHNPGRQAQMMARWTAAGSLGNLIGPLLVAASFALGFGWRWLFWGLGVMAIGLALSVTPHSIKLLKSSSNPSEYNPSAPPQSTGKDDDRWDDFKNLLPNLWQALRQPRLLRWLGLLEFSDLLLDVFIGYAALYFADVAGLNTAQVGIMIGALMFTSLLGDLVSIPLLERIPGRRLVRITSGILFILYPLWLLLPWLGAKIGLALTIRFLTLGWYPVLQGEAYATIPERSGTVMAINSLAGIIGGVLVWSIGWGAEQFGLQTAMWLLWLGAITLVLFVPKPEILSTISSAN